ncbi:hypothetical protein ACQR1W_31345 [Bradyrhizobium sp. HKCCYLS1011]|uniref:hypothetical protein n=1 Tax=Bradyrhizobium sp. HKCCYLS1011 TaxID=3420733 RepID=UPI003EC0E267
MKALVRLALAGLLALASPPAHADPYTIFDDGGGIIVKYVRKYADMRDNHMKLQVAGECASACTLFLGIMPATDYCVMPTARLGFHTASTRTESKGKVTYEYAQEFSYLMFSLYPVYVRKVIKSLGWDGDKDGAHPGMVWVEGDDLSKIAPICEKDGP